MPMSYFLKNTCFSSQKDQIDPQAEWEARNAKKNTKEKSTRMKIEKYKDVSSFDSETELANIMPVSFFEQHELPKNHKELCSSPPSRDSGRCSPIAQQLEHFTDTQLSTNNCSLFVPLSPQPVSFVNSKLSQNICEKPTPYSQKSQIFPIIQFSKIKSQFSPVSQKSEIGANRHFSQTNCSNFSPVSQKLKNGSETSLQWSNCGLSSTTNNSSGDVSLTYCHVQPYRVEGEDCIYNRPTQDVPSFLNEPSHNTAEEVTSKATMIPSHNREHDQLLDRGELAWKQEELSKNNCARFSPPSPPPPPLSKNNCGRFSPASQCSPGTQRLYSPDGERSSSFMIKSQHSASVHGEFSNTFQDAEIRSFDDSLPARVIVLYDNMMMRIVSNSEEINTLAASTKRNPVESEVIDNILRRFRTLTIEKLNHYSKLGEFMREMKHEDKMVDVVVHIGSQIFSAHRHVLSCHSQFFADILGNVPHKQKLPIELKLQNVTVEAFQVFLQYVYTGEISLDAENVGDLLLAAEQLLVPHLQNRCKDYITSVDPHQALLILARTKDMSVENAVFPLAFNTVLTHFEHLFDADEFMLMDVKTLCALLSSDDLVVVAELDVFWTALKWVVYDMKERLKHLIRVMNCVRFPLMSQAELLYCVSVTDLLRSNPTCRTMILSSNWLLMCTAVGKDDPLHIPRPNPRTCMIDSKHDVDTTFKIRDKRWSKLSVELTKMMSDPSFGETVHSNDQQQSYSYSGGYTGGSSVGGTGRGGTGGAEYTSENVAYTSKGRSGGGRSGGGGIERDEQYTSESVVRSSKGRSGEGTGGRSGGGKGGTSEYITETVVTTTEEIPGGGGGGRSGGRGGSEYITESEAYTSKGRSGGGSGGRSGGGKGGTSEYITETVVTTTEEIPGGGGGGRSGGRGGSEYITESEAYTSEERSRGRTGGAGGSGRGRGSGGITEYITETVEYTTEEIPGGGRSGGSRSGYGGGASGSGGRYMSESKFVDDADTVSRRSGRSGRSRSSLKSQLSDILVVGGFQQSDKKKDSSANEVERYNTEKNQWDHFAGLPEPRNHHAVAVVQGKLYLVGGSDPKKSKKNPVATATTFMYNLEEREWYKMADMKDRRMHHSVCALFGFVYAIGGQDDKKNILRSVECFNLKTNAWMYVASMRTARCGFGATVHENLIYVAGGFGQPRDKKSRMPVLNQMESYDSRTNIWTDMRHLDMPRCYGNLVSVEDHLYLCGGATRPLAAGVGAPGSTGSLIQDQALTSVSLIDVYDPYHNNWEGCTDLFTARHNAGAIVMGTKIYIIGGVSSAKNDILQTIECFDTYTRQWDRSINKLPHPATGIGCVAVPIASGKARRRNSTSSSHGRIRRGSNSSSSPARSRKSSVSSRR